MNAYKNLLSAAELVEIMEREADDNIADEIFDEIYFMQECNAKWERCFPYNGYEIYMAAFDDDSIPLEHLPAIAIKNGEARLLTTDEVSDYIKRYKSLLR